MGTCSFDGCGKPILAKGFCGRHYHQARSGRLGRAGTDGAVCVGCGEPINQPANRAGGRPRSYCSKQCEYRHRPKREAARSDADLIAARGMCSVDGCGKPVQARGVCKDHWYMLKRYGDANAPYVHDFNQGQCGHEGCGEQAKTGGFCRLHYEARHREENRDLYNAYAAARRGAQRAWKHWRLYEAEIEAVYKAARDITAATGIPHEVDHIVPIKGDNVCGLHVPWNIRVIPRSENRSKRNLLLDIDPASDAAF